MATLGFANGILAEVSTSVQANLDNQVVIFGSEGRIVLPNPWLINQAEAEEGVIEVHRGGEVQEIRIPADRTSFSYEADEVAKAVAAGRQEPDTPAMNWEDSLGNIVTLDRWRHGVGVVFVAETDPLLFDPPHVVAIGRENSRGQAGAGSWRPDDDYVFGQDQSFSRSTRSPAIVAND